MQGTAERERKMRKERTEPEREQPEERSFLGKKRKLPELRPVIFLQELGEAREEMPGVLILGEGTKPLKGADSSNWIWILDRVDNGIFKTRHMEGVRKGREL